MKNRNKIIFISLIALVIALIGFFAGRATVEKEIKYVKGKTITDTIYQEQLVPYEVVIPKKPLLPLKPDTQYVDTGKTIIKEIVMKVDTSKIIANYITLNKYKKELFNDDNGSLYIEAQVQYNELRKVGYTFTPIQKEVVKKRIIEPFISTSYNSFKFVEAGGGVFINNFGIEAKYVTDFDRNGFEVGLKYKF